MLKEKCNEAIQNSKELITLGRKGRKKGILISGAGALLAGIGAAVCYLGGFFEGAGTVQEETGKALKKGVEEIRDSIEEEVEF